MLLPRYASHDRHEIDIDPDLFRTAAQFILPKFITCRAICDILEGDGRVGEAITFYRQLDNELAGDAHCRDERAEWEPGE